MERKDAVVATIDLLDDDLPSDFFGDFNIDPNAPKRVITSEQRAALPIPNVHRESCKACRGTGTFYSWAGRPVGPCRKCKGQGFQIFKLSAAQRANARNYAEKAKVRKQTEATQDKESWIAAHPAEYDWMLSNPNFEFAAAMLDYLNRKGALTENQLSAVQRCVARTIARNETRAKEAAERKENAPSVNVLPMLESFANARAKGIKRPKMRIDDFKFSLAPDHGANAGAVYVIRKSDDQYLGKIAAGKFFRVRECDDVTEGQIVAICADPKKAAIAYGQRTGQCSVCGRELTNHTSIDAGIGPICAEKFGW
jgi:hypothetical protein